MEGRGQGEYELTFQPLQAGNVTGCIMFRDVSSGHFTWCSEKGTDGVSTDGVTANFTSFF